MSKDRGTWTFHCIFSLDLSSVPGKENANDEGGGTYARVKKGRGGCVETEQFSFSVSGWSQEEDMAEEFWDSGEGYWIEI